MGKRWLPGVVDSLLVPSSSINPSSKREKKCEAQLLKDTLHHQCLQAYTDVYCQGCRSRERFLVWYLSLYVKLVCIRVKTSTECWFYIRTGINGKWQHSQCLHGNLMLLFPSKLISPPVLNISPLHSAPPYINMFAFATTQTPATLWLPSTLASFLKSLFLVKYLTFYEALNFLASSPQ